MTTDLILGHTLLEEAEVAIWKNKVIIKQIPEKSKNEEMKSEETEDENEKSKKEPDTVNKSIAEEESEIRELILINHVDSDELQINKSYRFKISEII